MADSNQSDLGTTSTNDDSSKWEPYWDEKYQRYYWSDGNASVSNIFSYISCQGRYGNRMDTKNFRFGRHLPVASNRRHQQHHNHRQQDNNKLMLVQNMLFQWHMQQQIQILDINHIQCQQVLYVVR